MLPFASLALHSAAVRCGELHESLKTGPALQTLGPTLCVCSVYRERPGLCVSILQEMRVTACLM